MKKLILLFSHELTQEQKEDAKNNLGIDEFVNLPQDLKDLWSNVPPETDHLNNYIRPVISWLEKIIEDSEEENDCVLVQGEFGVTYLLVEWCFARNLTPVYAVSKRDVVREETQDSGEVISKKIFRHEKYRTYERLK